MKRPLTLVAFTVKWPFFVSLPPDSVYWRLKGNCMEGFPIGLDGHSKSLDTDGSE